MKHMRLLEDAGLVVTRKVGQARLHYLNPVPTRELHDRWTGKFAARWGNDVASDPPSHLAWEIEPAGEGMSELTVVHSSFEAETSTYQQVAGGMPYILSGLKTLLETGEPLGALAPEPVSA
jgi:hypothetical protein